MQQLKVLIILFGELGDIVRALPLACQIKKSWGKNCHLAFAVSSDFKNILAEHPSIDKTHIFDPHDGSAGYIRHLNEIKHEEFDYVLDLSNSTRSSWVSAYSGARRRIGFNFFNSNFINWFLNNEHLKRLPKNTPKISTFLEFCNKFDLQKDGQPEFQLKTPKEKRIQLEALIKDELALQGFKGNIEQFNNANKIIFIPNSNQKNKCLMSDDCTEILNSLFSKSNIVTIFVGNKTSNKLTQKAIDSLQNGFILNLVNKISLEQFHELFKNAKAIISAENDLIQIAATTNTPVISVFGAGNAKINAPFRNEQFIIQHEELKCLGCEKRSCSKGDQQNIPCMQGHSKKIISTLNAILKEK